MYSKLWLETYYFSLHFNAYSILDLPHSQAVVGKAFPKPSFRESLEDGVLLCE